MPSANLADYEIGDPLGAGTAGTIYLGTERSSGTRVAIKKLHPSFGEDKLMAARFRREMTILERLRHPNIIAYYGGGQDNGQLYYVMELIEGGTVKQLIQDGIPLRWPVVVEIARQGCSALQHAHNNGVIHRDLKPGNLFLTKEADVKLGDFGIARDTNNADLTDAGLTVGTHAYMAPEQITGDNTISGKADLYALGCCLYELLTGRKPYQGDNFAQLFEQHLRGEIPRVKAAMPLCPDELDEVVYQLLAKSPEDRPFNARQVQAVMLQLDDQFEPGSIVASSEDVGAGRVTELGRAELQQQIANRTMATPHANVSWAKLAVLAVALVVAVAAAAAMGR